MKRILCILLLLCMMLPACGSPSAKTQITVFAAASLTETVTELARSYESTHPDVEVLCNFDSSGTLAAGIEAGAPCDIFLSAGRRQMDALQEKDLLLADTRVDLLKNEIVLIVPANGDTTLTFDAVHQADGFIAIGNSDVPVGQYAADIFVHLGLWNALQGKISYGSNAKEVLAQVSSGAAACGVVYSTDAAAEDGVIITDTAPVGSHAPAVYPAARLTQNTAAADFYQFLCSDTAAEVFTDAGFQIP